MTDNTHSPHPQWLFVTFPAVVMSLGWAFRGFIGGGPLGAMIPGAMVALALLWLLGRRDPGTGMVAAFGAVGIGFGGQMTYGQTVGLASDLNTVVWGLVGLALKGAVWGLLGGALVGLALTLSRARPSRMLAGFGLMVLGTWLGWAGVNAPKLVYFSNRLDRPREEVWAGLLLGAIALLIWFAAKPLNRTILRFAGYSFVGGGLGFGLGGALLSVGRNSALNPQFWPWWKGMEYTFGLFFGLALGLAAWQERDTLRLYFSAHHSERAYQSTFRGMLLLAVSALLIAGSISFEYFVDFRFNYTVIGAVLLFIALYVNALAWHIAITFTSFAFLLDLAEGLAEDWEFVPIWAAVLVAAVIAGLLGRKLEALRARPDDLVQMSFRLLLWAAFLVTSVKTAAQVAARSHVPVEYGMFVVAMAAVWWLSREVRARAAAVAM
ncbi:MAG: hypothetical protein KIT83_05215 [Bryobacterales bacterium]|nr:hypothetical protein [Bryobacterales bacterium]